MGRVVPQLLGHIETVSTREVYRNQWMSVREDVVRRPDGSEGIYAVVARPDYAVVIPEQDGGFHLVSQYRYPTRDRRWEFPQGGFPEGRTGSAQELGRAELSEETGLRARSWTTLGTPYGWQGTSGQMFTAFLARDLCSGEPHREHEEQDMEQCWVPRDEFERMIRTGEVRDDSTLAAYLLLLLHEQHDGTRAGPPR